MFENSPKQKSFWKVSGPQMSNNKKTPFSMTEARRSSIDAPLLAIIVVVVVFAFATLVLLVCYLRRRKSCTFFLLELLDVQCYIASLLPIQIYRRETKRKSLKKNVQQQLKSLQRLSRRVRSQGGH